MGLRRVPYLAGLPARTWHLADLASVGCRGFNGPVPQPSLDTCSSVVPACYGLGRVAVKGGRPHLPLDVRFNRPTVHAVHQTSTERDANGAQPTDGAPLHQSSTEPDASDAQPLIGAPNARTVDGTGRQRRSTDRRCTHRTIRRPEPGFSEQASARSRSSSARCTGRGHAPTCRAHRSPTACTRRTASSCRPRRTR